MTAPTRVSNKQILDALNNLPAAIAAAMATNVAPPIATPSTEGENKSVKVDAKYLSYMQQRVQDTANDKGEDFVLYARKNGRDETKLAYCLASAFASKRDRGMIGPVATISPQASDSSSE